MDVFTTPIGARRVAEIEAEASAILAKLGLTSPPINVFDVANRLGVDVFFARFVDPSIEASVSKHADRVEISVAASPPARRRFSVAHELGHVALHLAQLPAGRYADRAVEFRRSTSVALGGDPKEAEANRFAAALLMPEPWVRAAVARSRVPVDLCATFDVSHEAMRRRLAELELA
ncbi:MAG: hypothetical protein NVS2B8_20260 [Vulcanimicrobiaceae bacterium]